MGEFFKSKISRRKSPSRIRYEKENPLLSIRIPREYREKVKDYAMRRCGSLSKYLRRCVSIEQTLVAMSIETLRKFFNLPINVVNELYALCKLEPSRTHAPRSFADLGLSYIVETSYGMKFNVAICLAYLFLHRYGGLSVEKLASIIKDPLDKARRGIAVAENEVLKIFQKALAGQKDIRSKWPLMVTDIMAMITWILIHSVDLKALVPSQKPSYQTPASIREISPKASQKLSEELRKIAEKIRRISEGYKT